MAQVSNAVNCRPAPASCCVGEAVAALAAVALAVPLSGSLAAPSAVTKSPFPGR